MAGTPDEYLDEPTEQLEPPRQLAPAILAIDIGGTTFEAGLVTAKGELVDRAATAVEQDVGPECALRQPRRHRRATDGARRSPRPARRCRSASGAPARSPPTAKRCHRSTLSAWREFPLRERLRELTAKRVYGDLDGKALALAEGWMGAAKGYDNYCVITVSTASAAASSSTASCSTGRRPTPATSAT